MKKTGGRAVDVIRGKWTPAGIQNGSSLRLENIAIILNDNQHPVRCVDLRRTDRVEVKNLSLVSYGGLIAEDSDMGLGTPPPVPAKGCIGLTMTDGSNYDYSNYINVQHGASTRAYRSVESMLSASTAARLSEITDIRSVITRQIAAVTIL